MSRRLHWMRLRKLETQLGITLANRDARRLSLTADGERFARESAHLLEQLEALPESFKQRDERLVGTLRLAAPFGYGRQRIAPLLSRFAKLHPQLRLHLDLRETPWPDRHDSDAVIHIGSLNDSPLNSTACLRRRTNCPLIAASAFAKTTRTSPFGI